MTNKYFIKSLALNQERQSIGTNYFLYTHLKKKTSDSQGEALKNYTLFYIDIFFRSLQHLPENAPGSHYIQRLFEEVEKDDEADSSILSLTNIKTALSFLSSGLKGFIRASLSAGTISTRFPVSIECMSQIIGKQGAYQYIKSIKNHPPGIADRSNLHLSNVIEIFTEKSSSDFESESIPRRRFEHMIKKGDFPLDKARTIAYERPGSISVELNKVKKYPESENRGKFRAYQLKADFTINDTSLRNHRTKIKWDGAATYLGTTLAFLSLYDTLSNFDSPNRYYSKYGEYINDPRSKLAKAFSDAFSSVFSINDYLYTSSISKNELIADAATKIFNKRSLIEKYIKRLPKTMDEEWLELLTPEKGKLVNISKARKYTRLAIKWLGIIGVILSLFSAFESYYKSDWTGLIGNSLTFIGSGFLLWSAISSTGFMVALALVVIGSIINLFADDDKDTWIRNSFWGTSSDYLCLENRDEFKIEDLIDILKKINTRKNIEDIIPKEDLAKIPKSQQASLLDNLKKSLETEKLEFIDITSNFSVTKKMQCPEKIEINCEKITTEEVLNSLKISAYSYKKVKVNFTELEIPLECKLKIIPQLTDNGIVTLHTNTDELEMDVNSYHKVIVELPRIPNGSYKETVTFK